MTESPVDSVEAGRGVAKVGAAVHEHPTAPQFAARSGQDFLLLLACFISFRLLTILFFKPGGEVYAGGFDFRFYQEMAELSLDGNYPYLDFWVEYPPLFPWAVVALYRLSLLLPSWPSPLLWFQIAVSSFLLVFEIGNLVLVYDIARRIHGPALGLRAGWLYASLFLPVYALSNWFDSFPLFFLLLSLRMTLSGRPFWAGAAVGVGFMAKVIPAVVGPVVLVAWRRWRERAVFMAAGAAVVLAIALPLLWRNATMFQASFTSMLARSSWLTPWALLEGYFDVGYMPPWESRFLPDHASWQQHSADLPWHWLYVTLGLSFAYLLTRSLRWQEPRILVAAAGLSLNLLLLFSKGFSPAFLVYVLALLIIAFPSPWGFAYGLMLTLNSFVEWPLAGVFFRDEQWLWWAVVLMRSALLVLVGWEYIVMLNPRLSGTWQMVRRAAALPAVLLLTALGALGGGALVSAYAASGPYQPIADYIGGLSQPGQTIVVSSREAFYGLKAYFPEDRFLSPSAVVWADEDSLRQALDRLTSESPQVWVVLDHSGGDPPMAQAILAYLDALGSLGTDQWFGPYRVLAFDSYRQADGQSKDGPAADFAGQVALTGWQSHPASLTPGRPFRVVLYWRALTTVERDYKAFVHLVDERGQLVAQRDKPLNYSGRTSSYWERGLEVREVYDILIPEDAPAGRYRLAVGLYDPQSGERLPVVGGGETSVSLGDWRLSP